MKKITKEICVAFIKNFYKSKMIYLFALSIFVVLASWAFTKNAIVVVCAAALLLTYSIISTVKVNQKIKNIPLDDFYLVEDEVVDFKKRFRSSKASISGYYYTYMFRTHGKYVISKSIYPTIEIPLKKGKVISHLEVEKLSMQCHEKGDVFYLLVGKEKEQIKILKGFPKHYFDVTREDFDLIDGKYYCKE